MERRLVITVDGPAGSGKSTVSRILAKRVFYMYLDTGLLYRAVAWQAMQRGVFITDDEAIGKLCDGVTIPLKTGGGNAGSGRWKGCLGKAQDRGDRDDCLFGVGNPRGAGGPPPASEKRRAAGGNRGRGERYGNGGIPRC